MREKIIYNKRLAFETYIENLLKQTASNEEFLHSSQTFDFYLPNGFNKLNIPKESYIEIKFFGDEKTLLSQLPYIYNLLERNSNLYLIINVNSNSSIFTNVLEFRNRIITLDLLNVVEFNNVQSKPKGPFGRIKKCIGVSMLNEILIYYVRSLIIKSYFKNQEAIDQGLIEGKDNTLFPFSFNGVTFYNSPSQIDYLIERNENYAKITQIKNKTDYLELIINGKYFLTKNDEYDFVQSLKEFLYFDIRANNINDSKYYKYKAFNSYSEETITDNALFFAPKTKLNDPFDLDIRNILAIYNSKTDEYDVKKMIVEKDPCLVLSLASRADNLLLWSHYADSHKGLCFEYKLNDIISAVDSDEKVLFGVIGNVQYERDRVKFTSLKSAGKLLPFNVCQYFFNIKSVFTKYKDWEYEKEFRVVLFMKNRKNNNEGVIFKVPYSFLYFTESIEISNKSFVLKNSKTKHYELKRDNRKYLLD